MDFDGEGGVSVREFARALLRYADEYPDDEYRLRVSIIRKGMLTELPGEYPAEVRVRYVLGGPVEVYVCEKEV